MKKLAVVSGILAVFMLPLLLTGWADRQDAVQDALRRGNQEYAAEAYTEAWNGYEQGLEARPEHKALNFNTAQAAYQLGEYEKAVEFYEQAEDSRDKYLNAGNSFYRSGDAAEDMNEKLQLYNQALEMYKEGITKYPQDLELKFNYEFVKQKLQELEQMEQESESEARMTSKARAKMVIVVNRKKNKRMIRAPAKR